MNLICRMINSDSMGCSAILGINCTHEVSNFTRLRHVKLQTSLYNSQIALEAMLLNYHVWFTAQRRMTAENVRAHTYILK